MASTKLLNAAASLLLPNPISANASNGTGSAWYDDPKIWSLEAKLIAGVGAGALLIGMLISCCVLLLLQLCGCFAGRATRLFAACCCSWDGRRGGGASNSSAPSSQVVNVRVDGARASGGSVARAPSLAPSLVRDAKTQLRFKEL